MNFSRLIITDIDIFFFDYISGRLRYADQSNLFLLHYRWMTLKKHVVSETAICQCKIKIITPHKKQEFVGFFRYKDTDNET